MRATLLSGVSRSCYCNPVSLLLQLPGQHGLIDDALFVALVLHCEGLRASIPTPDTVAVKAVLIQKQTRAKENRPGVYFLLSVSHGGVWLQLLTCLLSAPPDKGTVQKVIVLPSNQSLHEDLILEELEVFKVSCLSSLFFPLKSKAGCTWLEHKGQTDRQREAGWHSGDGCSAV